MGPEGMVHMMQMMGMMGQAGPGGMSAGREMIGMRMRAMTEHVEGRIAFLRAELKITQAQTNEWNQFAAALRSNARKLTESRPPAPQPGAPQLALLDRLAQQERWLTARSEGAQAIKLPLEHLYGTFSEAQKRIADQLIPPHLGLMPMGMM
jgi:hypothetical protein